jgi:hypothetical protein
MKPSLLIATLMVIMLTEVHSHNLNEPTIFSKLQSFLTPSSMEERRRLAKSGRSSSGSSKSNYRPSTKSYYKKTTTKSYTPSTNVYTASAYRAPTYTGTKYAYVNNYNMKPTSTYYAKKYTTVRSTRSYYNNYFNSNTRMTYGPLYVYYRPPGLLLSVYYYSALYGLRYNDGYGYNFYYGAYGYYEYSMNPQMRSSGGGGMIAGIVVGVLLVACICCCVCYMMKKGGSEDDEE